MPRHRQGLGYLGFADAAGTDFPAGTCWDCPLCPQPTWACRNALGASEPQRFSLSLSPKADPSPAGPALKALLPTPGMLRRTRAVPALQTGTQSLKTLINVLCFSSSSSSAPPDEAALTRLPRSVFVQHPTTGFQGWLSPRHQQGFAKAETLPQVLCSPCPAACLCLYVSFLVF